MKNSVITNEKNKKIALLIVGIILIIMLLIVLPYKRNQSNLKERLDSIALAEEQRKFIYLSDIPYINDQSSVGWGSLTLDQNLETRYNNGLITLIVNGKEKRFLKGISAHATSTVMYDLSDYNYDYFSTYYGIDASRGTNGNGVKFAIYTSEDGENWDLHTLVSPPVKKGNTEAEYIEIDIRGKKYLKLYCNSNGNNTADHCTYGNAMLYKEGYSEESNKPTFIKTVEEYDELIKKHEGENITGEYELLVLQRELVKNVGYDILELYANLSEKHLETLKWLFTDAENLRLYIMGGKPSGSYTKSFDVLRRLLETHKSDFDIQALTNYGNKYGDLYRRMAITLSLTHSAQVALWMQPSAPENQSDAVKRYEIYKNLHKNGKLKVTDNIDITKWFENYTVEEMRFVMNNLIDDEEIVWLNEYTQRKIDQAPNSAWGLLTPHPYMAYVWPNYANPVFHDAARKNYWDEKYEGIFSKYNVTYRNGLYKVWMNFRTEFGTGAVCGGISKTGHNIRGVHGIPAAVIGQPGHAAIIYYTQDNNGNGYWNLDNDVSGWTLSEKGERMLLGWGNETYQRGYSVVYMALSQEVLNNYDTFVESQKRVLLADSYKDLNKKENAYREALKIQPLNINAWYGLITTYNENEAKTEDEYFELAKEIGESMKYFPLPMTHLTNLIKPKLTSVQNSYKFTLLQTRILTEGTKVPNNSEENYYVYQPSLTRLEANHLLGKLDKTIATFSFDGEDAGKIVLSDRFNGNGVRWDYSLDGGNKWNEVAFTAEEEHKLQLKQNEIASITAENDIKIHIVGVNYDEENVYTIDITTPTISKDILFGNDLENRVVGINTTYEWRRNESDKWTSYAVASPDNTGDKKLQVRIGATGTNLPSNVLDFTFTEDKQDDTRKYIPVSHLSIHSFSTEAASHQGSATYAIDGNYNTRWHSAWNGSDKDRFIVIKLDKSVVLSAVEFVPAGGGNGKIYDGTIYGSMDGENWEVLSEQKGLTYKNQANTVDDAIANTKSFEIENPKEVQFVKIVADRTNGNWFTARNFNLYQDITKNPHPTAGIGFDITEATNQNVIARLINPSTEITITNNNGSDTYVFTENGEFTFEFEDSFGITGSATAKVNWIDKEAPTATIEYSKSTKTNGDVSAKLVPSEEVTILNNGEVIEDNPNSDPFTYLFMENGEFTFEFQDKAGNVGTATAKVDWIDRVAPNGNVTFNNMRLTNEDVTATIEFDEENVTMINNDGKISYVFNENGQFTFEYQDEAGNIGKTVATVSWIDKKVPTANVIFDVTNKTNGSVTATLVEPSEKITIINNDGKDTYTFTNSGEFTFEYKDAAGNIGKSIAKVDWIDKEAPTASIKYSTTEKTSHAVIATLTNASESITILNNNGENVHVFTENGEFTFKYKDAVGNVGETVAKVDWIVPASELPEEPSEPVTPENPEQPEKPGEPVTPENPEQPEKPSEPVTPENPEQPEKPSEPVTPENPEQPEEPSEPVTPENPEQPEEPSEPVTPEQSNSNNTGDANQHASNNSTDNSYIQNNVDSNNDKNKEEEESENYKWYHANNITLKVPSNVWTEEVTLKTASFDIPEELQDKITNQIDTFELYFETSKSQKARISAVPMVITMKLNTNKKLVGIYEVKEDNTLEPLSYQKISNSQVEIELDHLGKFVVSYEEEKEQKEVIEKAENNKNNAVWIIASGCVVIGGLYFAKVKNIKIWKKNK